MSKCESYGAYDQNGYGSAADCHPKDDVCVLVRTRYGWSPAWSIEFRQLTPYIGI